VLAAPTGDGEYFIDYSVGTTSQPGPRSNPHGRRGDRERDEGFARLLMSLSCGAVRRTSDCVNLMHVAAHDVRVLYCGVQKNRQVKWIGTQEPPARSQLKRELARIGPAAEPFVARRPSGQSSRPSSSLTTTSTIAPVTLLNLRSATSIGPFELSSSLSSRPVSWIIDTRPSKKGATSGPTY
jgi:hypothetical protein